MIRRALELPVIGTAIAVAFDALLMGGDTVLALLGTLLLSLGDILPILSMMSAYVAPQLDWLNSGTVDTVLLLTALLLVGVQIGQLINRGSNSND